MDEIILPRILLTNDDGIDAPGLAVLEEIAALFAQEVWIVAPEEDQSGASQKISLRQPLFLQKRGERRWAVRGGTPSDCVALAIGHLMGGEKPDLLLSGVNATCNIGDEVNLSGTIGAALTALMMDAPAIAISQDGKTRADVPWETTRAILPLVLKRLLEKGWRKDTAPCVNIPDLPPEKIKGIGWARQGRKNISGVNVSRRLSPRGEEYFWLSLKERASEADGRNEKTILERGEVAVTLLQADRSLAPNAKPFSFGIEDVETENEAIALDLSSSDIETPDDE